MARMALDPAEQELVEALRSLREQSGWTVHEQARALGLPIETLRGILYAKNRPGPRVLYRFLAYVDETRTRLGVDAPPILETIRVRALDVWQGHLPRPLDRFWDRVRWDFRTVDDLARFLRINPDEWTRFTHGEDPSPSLLQAVVSAYSHEAKRLAQQDPKGAQWCKETAEFAQLLMRLLTGRH